MIHINAFKRKGILIFGLTILFMSIQLNLSAQFGKPMGDVILSSTTPSDWPAVKSAIKSRILKYWGEGPMPYSPYENVNYRIDSTYEKYGLTHLVIRYEVIPRSWDRGIMVLPKNFDKEKKYKAVIMIHGTDGVYGADGMLDSLGHPNYAYPIELAYKGLICFVPDQFTFGESIRKIPQDSVIKNFNREYPNWSILNGRVVLGLIRSLDVLDKLSYVDKSNGYGVMGHSLGGKTALYLAAFDERISSGVVSCGISPMMSNSFRIANFQPEYWDYYVSSKGLYPWDMHDIIAMCAPKSMLFYEPINDPNNRYIDYSVEALMHAAPVWKLLGKPENFSYIIHGDGHYTKKHIRDYAYDWLIRNLK